MTKPIIGVVEWPYEDKDKDGIFEVLTPIITMISKNGGIPVGVFPTQTVDYYNTKGLDIPKLTSSDKHDLIKTLSLCSAILKPGATRTYDYERFIYDYAYQNDIPFLGICAGMQMMSHNGREKIINIKNDENGINHYDKGYYAHSVCILNNTLLSKIVEETNIMVNSRHGFHIPNEGSNIASAYAPDGVIEAIENPKMRYHLGVQWHPELMPYDESSQKLFNSFIEAANGRDFRKIKKR